MRCALRVAQCRVYCAAHVVSPLFLNALRALCVVRLVHCVLSAKRCAMYVVMIGALGVMSCIVASAVLCVVCVGRFAPCALCMASCALCVARDALCRVALWSVFCVMRSALCVQCCALCVVFVLCAMCCVLCAVCCVLCVLCVVCCVMCLVLSV